MKVEAVVIAEKVVVVVSVVDTTVVCVKTIDLMCVSRYLCSRIICW